MTVIFSSFIGIAVKPPSPQILDGQWRCDPGDSFEVSFINYDSIIFLDDIKDS